VADWDRAMRQALAPRGSAAPGGATGAPDIGDSAWSDQMLADAKRAHDFVMWTFGPPSAPQAAATSATTPLGAPQYLGGAPSNFVAAPAATVPPPTRPPEADDASALPLASIAADQQPDLGAIYGNRNITRQGQRAREAAAMRPPPAPQILDAINSLPRGIVKGLAGTASASGQAAQIEMQQPVDVPSGDEATDFIEQNITGSLPKPQGPAGRVTETIGEFLGNPVSYIGPGSLAAKAVQAILAGIGSEAGGELARGTRAEPLARIGGGMLGGGAVSALERAPAAADAAVANAARGAPRSPTAPAEPIQAPPVEPHANSAALRPVDPADVPLVPTQPPDPASALAAARLNGIDLDALLARAHEFHSALTDDIAEGQRTTAVLLTDGPTIIGAGNKKDIYPVQRRLLREGEIEARRPNTDAEKTVLLKAIEDGHRPRAIAATRLICDECAGLIKSLGGILTSDTTAVFPPY
jgi:hypothetical protein